MAVEAERVPASAWRRLTRWASQERVFKWVPFIPTQALFLFMSPAFLLLVYLAFGQELEAQGIACRPSA